MLDSVRSRLAFWHTGVLAVLLIGFAAASDLWLERVIGRRDDRFLEESTSAFRASVLAELAEARLDSALQQSLGEFRLQDVSFVVVDSAGNVIGRSHARVEPHRRRSDHRPLAIDTQIRTVLGNAHPGSERFVTLGGNDQMQRLFILPVSVPDHRFTIIGVKSLVDQQELLEDTRAGFLLAIPLGLLLAWMGGYALARRSLAPVAAMTTRAAAISATSLHARLPAGNPRDELGQLAGVLNELLARLDGSFEQQRRFMADASHELRTPVSIMRGEADIALSRAARSPEEYRDALGVVRSEGRRLSRIVEDLFLLARADSGQQRLRVRALYLDELVGDCVRVMRSIALARDVTLRCSVEPPASTESGHGDAHAYDGDEELLRRLVVNLLDNAIKHSSAGAFVDVRLIGMSTQHLLRVTDHGTGIPSAAQAHVFDRFFRADESHARDSTSETGGAGLGLSIALWVAEAHGGVLTLVSSEHGQTIFELRLPPSVTSAATTMMPSL